MGKGFARLVQLIGLEEAEAETIGARIRERLADPKDMRRFQQVTLLEHIEAEQLAAIKTHQDELPGVEIVDVPVRYYPYGTMASHLVGYMNEASAEDVEKKKDIEDPYRAGDRLGLSCYECGFTPFHHHPQQGFGARGAQQHAPAASERRLQAPPHELPTPGRVQGDQRRDHRGHDQQGGAREPAHDPASEAAEARHQKASPRPT